MIVSEKCALVALGANLPFDGLPAVATLRRALASLEHQGFEIYAQSAMYQTPCFPAGAGPDYVNAVVALRWPEKSDVASALERLHRVEAEFGRERAQRWGMRTLDLDLLAVGAQILPDVETLEAWMNLAPDSQRARAPEQLILPHPRIQDRAFVLVPLADVAPDWRHPVIGKTVLEMLEALPLADRMAIKPLE